MPKKPKKPGIIDIGLHTPHLSHEEMGKVLAEIKQYLDTNPDNKKEG